MGPCVCNILSVVCVLWYDGQVQVRLSDCAGPSLVNLLAELNSHSQLSLPILVVMESPAFYQKELLRLATVGAVQGVDKMGSPLGYFREPGLLWTVKWLP